MISILESNLVGIWRSKHCCPACICLELTISKHIHSLLCAACTWDSMQSLLSFGCEWGTLQVLRHTGPLAVALGQWLIELEGKYLKLRISRVIFYFISLGSSMGLKLQLLTAVTCWEIRFIGHLLCLFPFPTSLLVLLRITSQRKHLFARFSRYCTFLNSKIAFYK